MNFRNIYLFCLTISVLLVVSAPALQKVPGEQISNVVTNDAVVGTTTKEVFENLETNVYDMIESYDYYDGALNTNNYITTNDLPPTVTNFYGFAMFLDPSTNYDTYVSALDVYDTVALESVGTIYQATDPQNEYNSGTGEYTPTQAGMYLFSLGLNIGDTTAVTNSGRYGVFLTVADGVTTEHLQVDFASSTSDAGNAPAVINTTRNGTFIIYANGSTDVFSMSFFVESTYRDAAAGTNIYWNGGWFSATYLGAVPDPG
jgi:hypothetical protein